MHLELGYIVCCLILVFNNGAVTLNLHVVLFAGVGGGGGTVVQ